MRILIFSVLIATATTIACACPMADKETVAKSSPVTQSPGKGTAGIAVNYELKGKAAVGEAIHLQIAMDTPDKALLLVDVSASAGLGFAAGSLRREIASGEPFSLDLVPQALGRFYVNVIARNTSNGLARVVSIPVQVGAATQKVSRAVSTPDGELIVRLPAAE